jgi:protoporphyrinogen oxidase
MVEGAPRHVQEAAGALRWVSVLNINFGIGRPDVSDKHWVYIPEKKYESYRVGFPSSFSRSVVPDGSSSIYVEISYLPGDPPDENEAVGRAREDLVKMGILCPGDRIETTVVLHLPYAYVIFDRGRRDAVATIRRFLDEMSIESTGRFGGWTYSSMEDCINEAGELVTRLYE